MKSLIIIAHGSKLSTSNQEIIDLSINISKNSDLNIEYAFLEFAQPNLIQSITNCINKGATEISVFPYFLARGKHVKFDIPDIIKEQSKVNPDIKISLMEHFGKLQGIEKLILENCE
ncbi:MAG: Sirohydrochlorin ferrochelatase family protein [uncultured Campylobacterales bacterium]|uniref:Sirohydrochlorin ferrochelatase family protein n=1 Tax=uncultured Campylobacterales bacterium TaxID=352960 RepID=A0A6S6TBJ4_9BACT|nr:MAG: Sirohydrochlorin ferrochelatase family protein [uncultured Campylobacterales bacterium]